MKFVATILLSIHLLAAGFMPNADVHELGKLPNLVTHFLEHDSGSNISLAEFLTMHYGSPEGEPQEHQDKNHGDLPFQDHHHAWCSHAFIPASVTEWTSGKEPFQSKHFGVYAFSHLSQNLSAIFQPPRA